MGRHRRRTALDPLRLDYRRRVRVSTGAEVIVRARRKIDAESVDPFAVPLPAIVIALWTAVREFRNHTRYKRQWIVDVYPRFDPANAHVLAEAGKRQALDLVDRHVTELATTD